MEFDIEFDHVAISVKQLNESIDYYTNYFAFVLDGIFEKPAQNLRFAFLKKANFRLELFEYKDRVKGKDDLTDLRIQGLRHIAFRVKNVRQSVNKLTKSGLLFGPIENGTSCKYYTFTTDPNGISIELYEPNYSTWRPRLQV